MDDPFDTTATSSQPCANIFPVAISTHPCSYEYAASSVLELRCRPKSSHRLIMWTPRNLFRRMIGVNLRVIPERSTGLELRERANLQSRYVGAPGVIRDQVRTLQNPSIAQSHAESRNDDVALSAHRNARSPAPWSPGNRHSHRRGI